MEGPASCHCREYTEHLPPRVNLEGRPRLQNSLDTVELVIRMIEIAKGRKQLIDKGYDEVIHNGALLHMKEQADTGKSITFGK